MRTGFSAVKSGIVMFTVPLVFAIYPELLLIDKAVLDPASVGNFLPGYDGEIRAGWLAFLIARLVLALYLVSSSLSAFDRKALGGVEIAIRLAVAVLIMVRPVEFYAPAAGCRCGDRRASRVPEPASGSIRTVRLRDQCMTLVLSNG